MMRSLFSAVSGLRAHQMRMDVIGNNIANVNTPAFKSSRVTFFEVFSQTLRGGSAPSDVSMSARGGMNPMQVGLGVSVGAIDTNYAPGSLQPTSRSTDMAIEGNGFFVLQDGSSRVFTRLGAFDTDGDGVLVDVEGRKVLGWMADANGVLPADRSESKLSPIKIAIGSNMPAQATTIVNWGKNLDSRSAVGTTKTLPVTVFDSQGNSHAVTVVFEKTGINQWSWTAMWSGGLAGQGTLTFKTDGTLDSASGTSGAPTITLSPPGVDTLNITFDFSQMTQVAGPSTADVASMDGSPSGTLESFSVDASGVISGFYSNGRTRPLAQIALAIFHNPSGLHKIGKSLFVQSNNSGQPEIGEPGTSGRGTIAPSSLEMSNVDLAEEFTQMIVTQRGFQANSRVISVSDELLQELVNLKR